MTDIFDVVNNNIEARELFLFATNTAELHPSYKCIVESLQKKADKNIYNPELTPKAFKGYVESAARLYCKWYGGTYSEVFNPCVRYVVAEAIARETENEYLEGVKS